MVRGVTTPGTAPSRLALLMRPVSSRRGVVDDRRGTARDQAHGRLERGFAEIRIADGIEDQLMLRQRSDDRDGR